MKKLFARALKVTLTQKLLRHASGSGSRDTPRSPTSQLSPQPDSSIMKSKPSASSQDAQTISHFERLPRELRDQIYLHLGFPIAGRCLHNCDNTCSMMKYQLHTWVDVKGQVFTGRYLSRILPHPTKQAESNLLKLHQSGCYHRYKPLRGTEIGNTGEEEVQHWFHRIAGINLMRVNRFFYEDTAAHLYGPLTECSCARGLTIDDWPS